MYLLHHEEIESLASEYAGNQENPFLHDLRPELSDTIFSCLENVGMTSIEPIMYEGKEIVPLQFLKAVLPDPASLGPRTKGKTNIGCIFQGKKDGKDKTYYLYNVCDHQECYKEVGSQAVSYTTGVPAMIGAMMLMTGTWNKPGVHNIEEFDPDPFMDALNKWGLPWTGRFPSGAGRLDERYRSVTPYFLVDEKRLIQNLELLKKVEEEGPAAGSSWRRKRFPCFLFIR